MSVGDLDPTIHAPKRLRICAFLAPLEDADFPTLRAELGVSDSDLSKQLAQLERVGYVAIRKEVVAGRRRTWAGLTTTGRRAFARHMGALREIAAIADGAVR